VCIQRRFRFISTANIIAISTLKNFHPSHLSRPQQQICFVWLKLKQQSNTKSVMQRNVQPMQNMVVLIEKVFAVTIMAMITIKTTVIIYKSQMGT
jgi:gluconate kinase